MSSPAPKYASNEGVADAIHALLTDAVVELVEAVGEISVTVQRETLPAVMVKLRDDLAYQQLMEIAGVDYPDRPERFEICRSEEHTSELQSLMRSSYAVFCLQKKKITT